MPTVSFSFGTKAQTLERLIGLVRGARIVPLLYFTAEDWERDSTGKLEQIQLKFAPAPLAVRSSSLREDGSGQSMAGAFKSCLGVDSVDTSALRLSIEEVLGSFSGHPHDQVLVQPMVDDIAVSGVITTHVVDDGAPYYVLNYDDNSGKTDTVTGGCGIHKTVLVSRNAEPEMIDSPRLRRWVELTRELEAICQGCALDIEFAETKASVLYVLQVRRITLEPSWNREVAFRVQAAQRHIAAFFRQRSAQRVGLVGSRTILGEMPDWNPAEIIGMNPRPLATSLYRHLVTDSVWREARGSMGYRNPHHETLMVVLGGRPYIDVRNSFNSLLPADLDDGTANQIVDAWLDRLDQHPEMHDKVEFEIASTALDFDFDATWSARYSGLLTPAQLSRFKLSLTGLTRSCLSPTALGSGSLLESLKTSLKLGSEAQPFEGQDVLSRMTRLLHECREWGTLPFGVAARHAFIAESQLRSAVARGAITQERLDLFKGSLTTVAGRMASDLKDVLSGRLEQDTFLNRYGHLRPGTYDILSLRYDQREDLFSDVHLPEGHGQARPFVLSGPERQSLNVLLCEADLQVDVDSWLDYCRTAIIGREEVKFRFSRHLSEIVELIVTFGGPLKLSREHLSYLEIGALLDLQHAPAVSDPEHQFLDIARRGCERMEMARALRISYLVRDVRDLYVAPMHRSAPTFITNRRVEARIVRVDSRSAHPPEMRGAVVCIENADPGFDWIFTRGIAGLITQFGGSNSHMAVRSSELGLPAAIGCGEQTFARLVNANKVDLNCAERIVRPLYG
jgi:hypothetical protein